MLKNPLSTKNDVDALVAELSKEHSDVKTVVTLQMKMVAKALGQSVLIGAAAGAVIIAGIAVHQNVTKTNED